MFDSQDDESTDRITQVLLRYRGPSCPIINAPTRPTILTASDPNTRVICSDTTEVGCDYGITKPLWQSQPGQTVVNTTTSPAVITYYDPYTRVISRTVLPVDIDTGV